MAEELPIPEAVASDESSVEIVRVWGANREQHVTIDVFTLDDPAGWGLLLADLARHTARAYAQEGNMGAEEALKSIKERMDAEWDRAADR